MTSSLIISTYNWPEALSLVLQSILKQSIMPNEIIIADDGSQKETADLIKSYQGQSKIPIRHIWHQDNGFRKSEILNKSYLQAQGEYIIQIDGDIILHKNFIKDHLKNAGVNLFLHGSRCFLNDRLTKKAIANKINKFYFYEKGLKNKWNAIYLPFISNFLSPNHSIKKTRGCNFSCHKKDFILVNGYNEDMTGWGKEDTELSARLINNNIYKKQLKFCAISYHLEHKKNKRASLNKNIEILSHTLVNKTKKCQNGVNKYFNEK